MGRQGATPGVQVPGIGSREIRGRSSSRPVSEPDDRLMKEEGTHPVDGTAGWVRIPLPVE